MSRVWVVPLILALVGAAAAEPPIQVVATIRPLHSIAVAVAGESTSVSLLLPGAVSPHHLQLQPSPARALDAADVVVWVGPALETALAGSIARHPGQTAVALLETEGVSLRRAGDSAAEVDPHAWLDPANMAALARVLADQFARRDPVHAAAYRANAERVEQELAALDARVRTRLEPLRGRPFVTFHDAFAYFAARYGLAVAASVTLDADRPPTAGHLAELRRLFESDGARCLFTEPQFAPRIAERLTAGLEVHRAELDPLGYDIEPGAQLYARLLEGIADTVASCLAGR